MLCLSSIICLGSILRCGIFAKKEKKDTNALYLVLIVFVLMVSALIFSALHPHSPLLSITGEIKNSPYIYGLPTVITWCLIFLSALYAVQSQRIKTIEGFADLLTYGIRRFPAVLLIVMLLSYIISCLTYMFLK